MLAQLMPSGSVGSNGSTGSIESQPMHGGSSSVTTTVNSQVEATPLTSVTVHVTSVVPISKRCPLSVVFGAVIAVVAPLRLYSIEATPTLSLAVMFQVLSPCT